MMSRVIRNILTAPIIALLATATVARTPENHPASSSHESINTDFSDYIWPTDAGNIGTSTFGEFRRTHFHGGIDISTGNTTGFRVFAVRDGYVARIRVSPTGYGKMLYVRHADGYYSTYAHLSHFNATIDARVAREQQQQESFPVDLQFTPNEIPVRKGEVIAYTGDTGVGTPHLHFEIRDENLDPINPLLCTEFSFPDIIAPTIKRIAVSPLGERSTVNGTSFAHTFSVRSMGKRKYKVSETIQLTGEIGFGISVIDLANRSRFKQGVYSHKLYIDDKLFCTVQLDRVPGKNAHEIGLYYDGNLLDHGRGRFEKLYAESPSSLTFYTPKKEKSGVLKTEDLPEGPHTFSIVSTDFNGNSSEVTGKLILNHPPHFEMEHAANEVKLTFPDIDKVHKVLMYTKKNGNENWNLKTMTPIPYAEGSVIRIPDTKQQFDIVKVIAENAWGTRSLPQFLFVRKPTGGAGTVKLEHQLEADFVRLSLHAQHPFTEPPKVIVYEGASKRSISLTAIDINHYVGTFRPLDTFGGTRRLVADAEVNSTRITALDEFDLYPINPGTSGSLSFDGGKLVIGYDSTSVFKTVFMQVEKHQGLELRYSLLPENTILRGELRATVTADRARPGQGLFFSGLSNGELLDPSTGGATAILSGIITRTLGELSVKIDDTPPGIFRLSINGPSSRRPGFSFRCGDNFSGVEYKELKTYIDDVAVIPEVDGEHHKATYTATRPLERGSHRLTIRIKDKMGNSNVVERKFSVR